MARHTVAGGGGSAAWYVAALAAFAVLRVAALTVYPFWEDETWTLEASAGAFRAAMRVQADDQTHPPLFHAAFWAWRRLVPDTAAWLRLLPCLAAIATAVPVVALARASGLSRRATGTAIALTAGSGFLVAYGAELRAYALFALLGTASLALWARARADDRSLLPLTACNAALVHTHYFGAFVLLAEWIDALAGAKQRLRAITVSAALSVATLAPWVALTVYRARITGHRLEVVSWIPRPEAGDLLDVITASLGSSGWPAVDLAIAAATIVAVTVLLLRNRRTTAAPGLRLLALAAALPVAVSLGMSLVAPRSTWVVRYFIAAVPPLLLLLAAVTDAFISARATMLIGVAALLPGACTARSLVAGREKPRYDLVVREIVAREPTGTTIDVFTSAGFPVSYAARNGATAVRVHGEPDAARVRAERGWFVWSEVHAPPGHPPPALLIRRGYHIRDEVSFGAARDSLVAVRFERRATTP
jgi:uncharacterized membrane protein